jgi:PAS domain S-box-containing protein
VDAAVNLSETPELARSLFQESGDALFLVDPDTDELLDVNPMAMQLCGLRREELLGSTATALFRVDTAGNSGRLRRAAQQTGIFHSQEGYLLRTSGAGGWIPVNLTVTRLHVPPKPLGLITARDVREQREAHLKLKRMEGELRRVIAAVSDCLWSARIDPDGCWAYRFFTPVIERIAGRPPAFFLPGLDQWASVVHPDDRPTWEQAVARLRAGESIREEYRVVWPDGSYHWVRDSISVTRATDGQTLQLDGVLADITEYKRAEEETQLLLRLAIAIAGAESVHAALGCALRMVCHATGWVLGQAWVPDSEGQSLECSPAWYCSFPQVEPFRGASQECRFRRGEDLPGRVWQTNESLWVRDPSPQLVPERARAATQVGLKSALVIPIASSTEVLAVAEFLTCEDRPEDRYLLDLITGIAAQLGLTFLRKRTEEQLVQKHALLRRLIDSIPDLIFYKNPQGVYLGCNQSFEGYAGRREEDIVGRTDLDLFPADVGSFYQEKDRAVLAELKPRSNEEWLDYPDGRRALVEVLKTPFFRPDGQLLGLIGISRDITERQRLEEQLRQAHKMEAMGQLAGGVAHDFNNLLTVILGYSELLLGILEGHATAHGLVEQVKKAGDRAAALTRRLLAFSRRQVLAPRPLDLNAIVTDLGKMLQRLIGEDIVLETRLDLELPPVKADAGQIEQILMNLAVNARDAMPRGGRLTITTLSQVVEACDSTGHPEVEPGRYAVLGVCDTGCGMDAETRKHLFEPFFTTKGVGKGTGLGLAMVHGIVKQSGGFIEVHSSPGAGAAFRIFLPESRTEGSAGPGPVSAAPPAAAPATVLVAEDEEQVRGLVRAVLEQHGYTVLEAADGQEALRVCEGHDQPIDLLITDILMPEMNGRDLARRMTELRPDVRVLYISGYSGSVIVRQGLLEAGAAYLQKPFAPEALVCLVREVLHGQSLAPGVSRNGSH